MLPGVERRVQGGQIGFELSKGGLGRSEIDLPGNVFQPPRGCSGRRSVEMTEQTVQAMGRKDQCLGVLLDQRAEGTRHPRKPILPID